MRTRVLLLIFALSICMLLRGQESATSTGTGGGEVPHPITQTVRALATQGQVVPLPTKGQAKYSIEKDAQVFALPTGMSPVVLFKLPDYHAPYTVTIMSPCNHGCLGFSKSLFVPSGVFLDAAFKPTRELPNTEFQIMPEGFSKPYRLETTVLMDEARKSDAYLILFTLPDDVGRVVERMKIRTSTGAPVLIGKKTVDVKGSAHGSLKLEARPANPGSADQPHPGAPELRSSAQQQPSAAGQEQIPARHASWSFLRGKGPGESHIVTFRQFSAPKEELGLFFTCAQSTNKWTALLLAWDHPYLMHVGIWYRFDKPETSEAFVPIIAPNMPDASKAIAVLDEDVLKMMLAHSKVCFSVPAWADEKTMGRQPACPGGAVNVSVEGRRQSKGKTGVFIDGEFSLEGLQETMRACHCGERHVETMLESKK